MSTITAEQWAEKIAALLAKAEHKNTSPEEAAVFTAKAQELMTKWALDEAQVRRMSGVAEDTTIGESIVFLPSTAPKPWARVGVAAAEANGCRFYFTPYHKGYRKAEGHIIGTEANRRRALMMFTSLQLQIAVDLPRAFRADRTGVSRHIFTQNFIYAFGDTAHTLLVRAAKDAGSDGLNLPIHVDALDAYMKALGLTKSWSRFTQHAGAAMAGRDSARNADLGRAERLANAQARGLGRG